MARIASTVGVSMAPEDRVRWERLKGSRRTSAFVRHLLDLEQEQRDHDSAALALLRVRRAQSTMPRTWAQPEAWHVDSAGADVTSLDGAPADLIIDMRGPAGSGYRVGPA